MMEWEKIDRNVNDEGTTITYRAKEDRRFIVQSRKRHIPHANGVGTWDHTSYFVIVNGKEVAEKNSLKDAKEYAEEFIHELVQ